MRMPAELSGRWNHNTHYYPLALAATPCGRALDIGCGDGLLLRLLAARCGEVVGVDPWTDPAVVADLPNVTVLREPFLDAELEPFALVCSFAAIHHMPLAPALRRMVSLVAPGGRLVVSSISRPTPARWPIDAIAIPVHHAMARRRGYWQHPAPIADAGFTSRDVRRLAKRVAAGATFRTRLYWRWTLMWQRPR